MTQPRKRAKKTTTPKPPTEPEARSTPTPPDLAEIRDQGTKGPTEIPAVLSRGTFFVTIDQAAALGLSPDTAEAQLADAGAVYTQITNGTMATRDTLTQWAAGVWGTDAVNRLNAALGLLRQMGLVFQVN